MLTERVKKLTPYIPGEQPRIKSLIKLNTNENPYLPAPKIESVLRSYDPSMLQLYPDPLCTDAIKSISEKYRIPEECIFLSNGSDELLAFSFYSFFESSRGPLLFPDITYSFYPVYCSFFDIGYTEIPVTEKFLIDLEMYKSVKYSTGIIIANPNAPTGIALKKNEIVSLLRAIPNDRVVIIDEAYVDFGAESCVPLVGEFDNLFVIKTMSKAYSLAGMRLGYAFGQPGLIKAVTAAKDSFNSYPVSRIGQAVASAAFSDAEYHDRICSFIIKTRSKMIKAFRSMGWDCLESKSNFIFVSKKDYAGTYLMEKLREENILVRNFNKGRIKDWLRISVGTEEETDMLIEACKRMFP